MGNTAVKRATADPCPPKSKPCTTSLVRPVDFSAYSRSTVTSALAEYLHLFIDAEVTEVFSDISSNANMENSGMSEPAAVRSYVTNEYAGLMRSRENVI